MVNLEWYRTFKAVYQSGSLTAASKALFISQPNVSQHLSALEGLLSDKKLKLIWKGESVTDNTLYLVYDKSKVTTEQINIARMLINEH